MKNLLFRVGNWIYKLAPALYMPMYSAYKRYTDAEEIQLITQSVMPGAKVIDIGANVGFYSELLSKLVGPEGKVYSFEPEPHNYSLLCRRVGECPNVVTINGAVGSQSGVAKLFVSTELNVDHHTYDDGSGRPTTDVRVYSIDDYFRDLGAVDFIKMDIQGHEYQALLGAQKILKAHNAPRLLFEFWPFGMTRAGDDPVLLLNFLADCGYTVKFNNKSPLPDIKDVVNDSSYYVNIFAYKPLQ